MTKTFLVFALLITVSKGFSQTILLECGTTTRAGFDGWSISPYNAFDNIVFTDETIDFYSENGGDYTISLTRKIEEMKSFSWLDLTVQIDAVENCTVHYIDAFVSEDGKTWINTQLDQTNFRSVIQNEKGLFQFLKIAINVSFESNGYLQCAYLKLEGENEWEMEEIKPESQVTLNPFFIFCFNKSVNIETKSEEPYDVIFSNIAGQIVYTESTTGSTRIETELPEGIYVISIFQNGAFLQSKKVIF